MQEEYSRLGDAIMGKNSYINNLTNFNYLDAVMISDNEGKIIYFTRYNPRFSDNNQKEFKNLMNKNLFEIYPTLNPDDSSIIECMNTKRTIYNENQSFYDYAGRLFTTQNLTIPIVRSGKVLGAIELTQDVTHIQDVSKEYKYFNIISKPKALKSEKILYTFDKIITDSNEMKNIIEKAKLASNSNSSILIYGETGTGKELFAQSIHNFSNRRNSPFIAQNCAALPESLFESLLFGTVSGSFTGAMDKPGLFEMANNGTLFLDEVNSLPATLQAKLLRVLQDGLVRRIGDTKDRKVNVRIISAMNDNPVDAVKKNLLRQDFFFRINVISIRLIPLRERKEDIKCYIEYFINEYNETLNKSIKGITKEAENLFYKYKWPGNVREIKHVIEAAMNICQHEFIGINDLPIYLNDEIDEMEDTYNIKPFNQVMESIEKKLIIKALKKANGNVSNTSTILGIARQTLQYKIQKYNIKVKEFME